MVKELNRSLDSLEWNVERSGLQKDVISSRVGENKRKLILGV